MVSNDCANKVTLALEALKEGSLELWVFKLVDYIGPLLFCFGKGDRPIKQSAGRHKGERGVVSRGQTQKRKE